MEPLVPVFSAALRYHPSQRYLAPFIFACARLKFVPEYFCGVCDPIAIEGKRCHAGQAAATLGVLRTRRPADDPDDGRPAGEETENRSAGITRAGAQAGLLA